MTASNTEGLIVLILFITGIGVVGGRRVGALFLGIALIVLVTKSCS